jgi:N-acetylglucosamine repressor
MRGKVDSRAMREVNRSIVLDMIRRGGRISRTDLARRSHLTKPTVSAIVEDLIAGGVVQEVGFGKAVASGGRRARLLQFNEASAAYLGIRVGVHTTSVAIADARGQIRIMRELPTAKGDAIGMIDRAIGIVDETFEAAEIPRERLQAVGVTVPGLVDTSTGVCVLGPNVDWKNVPVVVQNVTNAGAIAEGQIGAAQGYRSYVWVYVGSGLGAGIVLDGRPFYGRQGFSGEIGHCQVVESGILCGCGAIGCLETVASGRALERQAQQAVDDGQTTRLSELDRPIEVTDIVAAAGEGDELSISLFEAAGTNLGKGLAYLQNILNPEIVVLGGRVVEAGDLLLKPARRAAHDHALKAERVPIVSSVLKERSGIVGAVLSAMDLSVQSYRIVATNSPINSG